MEEKKDLGSYDPEGTADAAQVPCAVGYTPELLEALISLRKYVKRAPYGVLRAADAAIAKALGK